MTKEEAIKALKSNYPSSCYTMLREAVDMAIEALSQPSLPSNLDEAAEEELDDVDANWQIDERGDGCTEPGYNYKQMLLMFKAGAEWMAGQGWSRELEVKEDAGGYPYIDKHIELYDYDTDTPLAKKGDKVVVQIRKANGRQKNVKRNI